MRVYGVEEEKFKIEFWVLYVREIRNIEEIGKEC